MKKASLFSAALAATVLLSCNKDVKGPSAAADGHPVEVTVSITGAPPSRAAP